MGANVEGREMNATCKIIGHKWTLWRRIEVDGMRADELVILPFCVRCGKDAPDTLRDGQEPCQVAPAKVLCGDKS